MLPNLFINFFDIVCDDKLISKTNINHNYDDIDINNERERERKEPTSSIQRDFTSVIHYLSRLNTIQYYIYVCIIYYIL